MVKSATNGSSFLKPFAIIPQIHFAVNRVFRFFFSHPQSSPSQGNPPFHAPNPRKKGRVRFNAPGLFSNRTASPLRATGGPAAPTARIHAPASRGAPPLSPSPAGRWDTPPAHPAAGSNPGPPCGYSGPSGSGTDSGPPSAGPPPPRGRSFAGS